MTDRPPTFTIGQLARRTGLSVRTIRFWSDAGVAPPAGRSAAGYRLYDAEALARLELVRTLRELGLDLATVRKVLAEQGSLTDVAAAHARALDGQIRTLRLRRAVLRAIAERGGTTEEIRLMHRMARLSAQERQHIIDEFVDATFAGVDPHAPGAGLAAAMRALPGELPDDPTPAQVDAWVELAELVADEGFRRRVRQMALAGPRHPENDPAPEADPALVIRHAGAALADGVPPESDRARAVLDRIVDPAVPAAQRVRLADQLAEFTDRRVERYWQLIGELNGRPAFPPAVPAFEWLIAALRAHAPGGGTS